MFTKSRYNLKDVLEHKSYGKIYIDAIAWFPVKGYLYTFILPDGQYRRYYESKLVKEVFGWAFVNGVEQRNGPKDSSFMSNMKTNELGWDLGNDLNAMFSSSMPAKRKIRPFRTIHDVVWVDFKNKKRA